MWPHIMIYVTSVHNWPSTNFFPLWLKMKYDTQTKMVSYDLAQNCSYSVP